MKYRYAINQYDQMVSIENVKNRAGHYVCVNCGGRMAPRLGEKNEHHFYHLVPRQNQFNTIRNCAPETYLHRIAKKLFQEAYTDRKAFILKWKSEKKCTNINAHNGCFQINHNSIDLISMYPDIGVEKKDGDFIPDILLSNASGEKIYIEFANSHLSSQKKLQSGERIVEIIIKQEEDIEQIIQARTIDEAKKNIEFYGFKSMFFDCMGKCFDPKIEKVFKPSITRNPQENFSRSNTARNIKTNIQVSTFIKEYRESYYYVKEFKFLIREIIIGHKCPNGFEGYIGLIPTIDEVEYEVYLEKQLINRCCKADEAKKIAEDYVQKITPPTLF